MHAWFYACILHVLLKALPPVCMKYTARGESRVANIARGEAECYICHDILTKSCILSYKRSGSALSVLLYLTEDTPLKFNTLILLNRQTDKNVSIVLPFYNYSSVL